MSSAWHEQHCGTKPDIEKITAQHFCFICCAPDPVPGLQGPEDISQQQQQPPPPQPKHLPTCPLAPGRSDMFGAVPSCLVSAVGGFNGGWSNVWLTLHTPISCIRITAKCAVCYDRTPGHRLWVFSNCGHGICSLCYHIYWHSINDATAHAAAAAAVVAGVSAATTKGCPTCKSYSGTMFPLSTTTTTPTPTTISGKSGWEPESLMAFENRCPLYLDKCFSILHNRAYDMVNGTVDLLGQLIGDVNTNAHVAVTDVGYPTAHSLSRGSVSWSPLLSGDVIKVFLEQIKIEIYPYLCLCVCVCVCGCVCVSAENWKLNFLTSHPLPILRHTTQPIDFLKRSKRLFSRIFIRLSRVT
jgi:hypothetical protein